MNIPKHADLIHAFADGKVLQFMDRGKWKDWDSDYCPNTVHYEVRIKPDEPKKAVIATLKHVHGAVEQVEVGSRIWENYVRDGGWIHLTELDREVTLPVEES